MKSILKNANNSILSFIWNSKCLIGNVLINFGFICGGKWVTVVHFLLRETDSSIKSLSDGADTASTEHTFCSKVLENTKPKPTRKDPDFSFHAVNLTYQSPKLSFFVEKKKNPRSLSRRLCKLISYSSFPTVTSFRELHSRLNHLLPSHQNILIL